MFDFTGKKITLLRALVKFTSTAEPCHNFYGLVVLSWKVNMEL